MTTRSLRLPGSQSALLNLKSSIFPELCVEKPVERRLVPLTAIGLFLCLILLTVPVAALSTVAHGTVNGETYVASTSNWPSGYSTNTFNVPDGEVVFARFYAGIWTAGWLTSSSYLTTTFNGHTFDPKPSYYVSGMGVTWVPYDVTDYVKAGEVNTATVGGSWGDGRQYGSTLVVVLRNESMATTEYWVTEGLDWLNYQTPVDSSATTMEGTVDNSNVQTASLYSVHLTGYNYEDLNGYTLPAASEYMGGSYINAIRWDGVENLLVPGSQVVNVGRGDDSYCSPVLHVLSIEYKRTDLVPVSLTPAVVTSGTSNTMTATIENRGNIASSAFNVSLLVNDEIADTATIDGIEAGGTSKSIDLHWTPDGTSYRYSVSVVTDTDNAVSETDESNNRLTIWAGTSSAPAPVAGFTTDRTSGLVPLEVQFTDQSGNLPISWAWDFNNDGVVDSTEQNPSYTFTTIGTYTVKLTATNGGGSNPIVKSDLITVSPVPPVAAFTATPVSGYTPLTVTFTDASTGTAPRTYAWDFNNDGIVDSTEQNPSYTYVSAGTFSVILTVTNGGGSNSIVKAGYITVSPVPPVSAFTATPTSGYTPLTVTFTDASTGTVPRTYAWDFNNDGVVDSTEQNPSYTYTSAGIYTVKLTVTNAAGSDEEIKTDYVTAKPAVGPLAAFTATPTSGYTPLTVQFTDTSTGTAPLTYAWDFNNDGVVDSTEKNPSYTYTSVGSFSVKLTVTNPAGTDDEVKTGYIATASPTAPVAAFTATPTSGTVPLTVQFTDASTGTAPLTYAWDFNNDGVVDSTNQNPSYTYPVTGTYSVKLTVTNKGGSNTVVKTGNIIVKSGLVAAFTATPASGTVPLTVQFTDQSGGTAERLTNGGFESGISGWTVTTSGELASCGEVSVMSYQRHSGNNAITMGAGNDAWIGSGSLGISQDIDLTGTGSLAFYYRTETEVGGYPALSVDGNNVWTGGDAGSWTRVSIDTSSYTGVHTVRFSFNGDGLEGPGGSTIYFDDISATSSVTPSGWSWDFGDGTTSEEQSPSHTFTTAGTYTVKLTVTDAAGATDEESLTLTAEGSGGTPVPEFPAVAFPVMMIGAIAFLAITFRKE